MKTSRDSPRAESMEEHVIGVLRFVGVVFVKQFSIFSLRVLQPGQLLSEFFHLLIGQNRDSAQVAILVKKLNLFLTKFVLSSSAWVQLREKRSYWTMMN